MNADAPAAFLDGEPATADDLRALALANYGHFTSMQVRDRAVRGLDLHLQRLQSATRELFDAELDASRVRRAILSACDGAGIGDASVRVTVFSRAFDYSEPDNTPSVDVLASVSPPRAAARKPMWAKSYRFERPLPHLKHVGTFPLFEHRRRAKRAGFDDALFVDAKGRVSEGSIWNIGFWDGAQVTWPRAEALRGTTERLLQAGLAESGIPQSHEPVLVDALGGFLAAFATNATGVQPISGIDETTFRPCPDLLDRLASALDAAPWQSL